MPSIKTCWSVGRVRGVRVDLHASLLVIPACLAYALRPENRFGWRQVVAVSFGYAFGLLAHEAGHVLAARWTKRDVERVVLWPLGGRTLWRQPAARLRQTFLVAVAGPLVSVALAAAIVAFLLGDRTWVSLWPHMDPVRAVQVYLAAGVTAYLNAALAVVNLLPVEPLDGGTFVVEALNRMRNTKMARAVTAAIAVATVVGLVALGATVAQTTGLVFGSLAACLLVAFNPASRRWLRFRADLPSAATSTRLGGAGWVAAALMLFALGAAFAPGGTTAARVLVLEHVNVIDGISDAPQYDVTVVVKDGRIAEVAAAPGPLPADARRLDLRGRWLLPGFIDAHLHPMSIEPMLRLLADDGVTTCRSMFAWHYMDVALRDRHRQGAFDLPEVLAAGYPVPPDIGKFPIPGGMESIYVEHPRLRDLGIGRPLGAAGAERIVRADLERQVDVVKVFATNRAHVPDSDPRGRALSDEQLSAAVAVAHAAGLPVAAHAYGDEGVAAAVRAGVNTVEHGVWIAEATLAIMKERGVALVPTVSAFPMPDAAQFRDDGSTAMLARDRDMAAGARDTARRAWAMGVTVLAGTDGSGSIGNEIVELAGAGLTRMDAIRAATSKAAHVLGLSSRTGSIQPGLEADLVVLDANPLDDIKAVTRVVVVINDGRIIANRMRARQR